MKMQKKQFRIGELAKKLNVERFVIRFWEKEFNLKAHRSTGGQRFYEEKDYDTFCKIKELLYKKGFTINGARQQIQHGHSSTQIIGSHKTTINKNESETKTLNKELLEKINHLKKKIQKLSNII